MKYNIKPNLEYENQYSGKIIVGIDEVGRGPLAGPLVAAAVILNQQNIPKNINDSKKLSASMRQFLYKQIIENSAYGVGITTVEEIESYNLTKATELAMTRAIDNLGTFVEVALIDGNIKYLCNSNKIEKIITIIKGDTKSLSIAAASIIAKVTRDKIMSILAEEFPCYLWQKNFGYGTIEHIKAIEQYGITIHHRSKFAPIVKYADATKRCYGC